MPEAWTGDLVGKMHNYGITYDELGAEIGVGKAYISMLLNSKRNPPGTRERLEKAVCAIIARKEEEKQ